MIVEERKWVVVGEKVAAEIEDGLVTSPRGERRNRLPTLWRGTANPWSAFFSTDLLT